MVYRIVAKGGEGEEDKKAHKVCLTAAEAFQAEEEEELLVHFYSAKEKGPFSPAVKMP